jgi:NAD+ diphosphatase
MTVPASASPQRDIQIDRRAEERADESLLTALREDPTTRVLVVRGDAAPFTAEGHLALSAPASVPEGGRWAFLGRDDSGAGVLLAAFDVAVAADDSDAGPGAARWGALRSRAAELPPGEASLLVTAVALGRWLVDSPYCPACGALARETDAGWSRRCPSCGRQHFPRTDPAVIVAVTSPDDPDLLLLGSNALWENDRYSCFAGFAEAGESLEDAVVREVGEEAGVVVGDVRYRGSQGWPYPRSLMLGFRATAKVAADARPDGEEILSVRWFTRDEIGAGLSGHGEVKLPGPASIAHRLISEWHAERP